MKETNVSIASVQSRYSNSSGTMEPHLRMSSYNDFDASTIMAVTTKAQDDQCSPELEPRTLEHKSATTFTLFNELPPELRTMIWQLCLPHRIIELDEPPPSSSRLSSFRHCSMRSTTLANYAWPAIASVCFEAREVARKKNVSAALWLPVKIGTTDARIALSLKNNWRPLYVDYTQATPYRANKYEKSDILDTHITRCAGDIVLPIGLLKAAAKLARLNIAYPESQLGELLATASTCYIVQEVYYIHDKNRLAASSGLFGLLGDAPIQFVVPGDVYRLEAFYNLAERCKDAHSPSEAQTIPRRDGNEDQALCEKSARAGQYDETVIRRLQSVVMFRLCTKACSGPAETLAPMAGQQARQQALGSGIRVLVKQLKDQVVRMSRT